MVLRKMIVGKKYFECSLCNFLYESKEKAMECEKWCLENGNCNPEITKYSVGA